MVKKQSYSSILFLIINNLNTFISGSKITKNSKSNGGGVSSLTNGPINTDSIQVYPDDEEHAAEEHDGDDETKSVHGTRSTDLIFLKSVVLTNTLERPKKVSIDILHLSPSMACY